ncbi:hypothetical protein [Candidatus Harpocratesius sp.]
MTEITDVQKICQIILQNQTPQIKEEDIKNLIQNDSFEGIMSQVIKQLKNIGFSLVRTSFLGEKFYVLTSPGKDEKISPTMYGILVSLIALYKELGTNITEQELKKIFKNVWNECSLLIEYKYLEIHEQEGIKKVLITPIGKAVCKDIVNNVDLHEILSFLEKKG